MRLDFYQIERLFSEYLTVFVSNLAYMYVFSTRYRFCNMTELTETMASPWLNWKAWDGPPAHHTRWHKMRQHSSLSDCTFAYVKVCPLSETLGHFESLDHKALHTLRTLSKNWTKQSTFRSSIAVTLFSSLPLSVWIYLKVLCLRSALAARFTVKAILKRFDECSKYSTRWTTNAFSLLDRASSLQSIKCRLPGWDGRGTSWGEGPSRWRDGH